MSIQVLQPNGTYRNDVLFWGVFGHILSRYKLANNVIVFRIMRWKIGHFFLWPNHNQGYRLLTNRNFCWIAAFVAQMLPKSLGNLTNLQSLDLRNCDSLSVCY